MCGPTARATTRERTAAAGEVTERSRCPWGAQGPVPPARKGGSSGSRACPFPAEGEAEAQRSLGVGRALRPSREWLGRRSEGRRAPGLPGFRPPALSGAGSVSQPGVAAGALLSVGVTVAVGLGRLRQRGRCPGGCLCTPSHTSRPRQALAPPPPPPPALALLSPAKPEQQSWGYDLGPGASEPALDDGATPIQRKPPSASPLALELRLGPARSGILRAPV